MRFPMPPNPEVFDVNHPAPLVDAHVLGAIWGVSAQHILKRAKRGDFDFLMPRVAVTGPKKWSGHLLAMYLRGEELPTETDKVRSFGRGKGGRRGL